MRGRDKRESDISLSYLLTIMMINMIRIILIIMINCYEHDIKVHIAMEFQVTLEQGVEPVSLLQDLEIGLLRWHPVGTSLPYGQRWSLALVGFSYHDGVHNKKHW